jgi:hypothetical protein
MGLRGITATRRSIGRRLAGLTGIVALTAAVNAAVLPLLLHRVPLVEWAGFALGQTFGSLAAVLIGYGWSVFGPVQVGMRDESEWGRFVSLSLWIRVALFCLIAPVAILAAVVLAPDGSRPILNSLGCATVMLFALGAPWFFIGAGKFRYLALFDAFPRVAGVVVGAVILVATDSFSGYVCAVAASSIACLYATYRWIFLSYGHARMKQFERAQLFLSLRNQAPGVLTAATASVYLQLPLVIVSLLHPSVLPTYAIADRLQKYGTLATAPMVSIAQSYVARPSNVDETRRRVRKVLFTIAPVSIATALVSIPGLIVAVDVLAGGRVALSWSLAIPLGLGLGAALFATVTGLACLSALDLESEVVKSGSFAAIAFLLLVLPLDAGFGPPGVAWSAVIAEVIVVMRQLAVLGRPRATLGTTRS